MTVDLSTPWVPTLDGNQLAPFAKYEELVQDEEMPSAKKSPEWSIKAHKQILEKVPEVKEALWETVLGVYRLQMLEEEADELWINYLQAWLVRRDLRDLRDPSGLH